MKIFCRIKQIFCRKNSSGTNKDEVDLLNSKTKKLRIELPDYNFRHSPVTSRLFLGRKKLKERLADILTKTSTHQGVYLVAGDRGVGKTSLVEEVIKETSLSKSFPSWLKFLLSVFSVIFALQIVLCKICEIPIKWDSCTIFVLGIIIVFLSCLLGKYSPHKRRRRRFQKSKVHEALGRVIRASVKEFLFIQSAADPFVKQLYLLKMVLIICVVMFFSGITEVSPIKVFSVYLSLLLSFFLKKYIDHNIYKEGNNIDKSQKLIYYLVDILCLCSLPAFLILIILGNKWYILLSIAVLAIILNFIKVGLFMRLNNYLSFVYAKTVHNFIDYFSKYIRNYPRIYIKINFGQEGQSKRDILRLIAKSLQTNYLKYCSSVKHMFLWWATSFTIILFFTVVFYNLIYKSNNTVIDNKLTFIVDKIINHIFAIIDSLSKYLFNMELDKDQFAFVLIFICSYLLARVLLRITTITTPSKVRRQLKNLNDAIAYNMERMNNQGISVERNFLNLHGAHSVKKSRTIADEGEIEMELQAIFVTMQDIPLIMCRPEWVIVFDELDKMEPRNIDNNLIKDNILSLHASREKQSVILKLLSDLKYFLSTAEAQFIFIAGREMYDIYLADISERSNLLGSIFNDVVFVPSFLSEYTDTEANSDMTSMVEKYVCTHIIPSFYTKFPRNLKGYKQYLDEIIYNNKTEKPIVKYEEQRIIACLQQFIFYLAYTSKGAPKKIVQIFESYIQTYSNEEFKQTHNSKLNENDERESHYIDIKWYRNSCFFLTFDYYDQFMLGMTSYLVAPVMYRFIDSNIQKHSDKLLVSSLRFIDFMFKFHRHNFSWKSLDISPELIEVNRAPELKSIAENLTNFLLRIHIDKSYSALYEYRFDNLISQEISFVSKVCEQFSAMFNFSLDESLVLKNHYKKLLKETKERTEERTKNYNLQHSITSLQIVLGDLHFYDDEFEDAATYYKDGIQSLPPKDELFKNNEFQHVYIYIRNMLKLGFVYEKRKQYDFAFLTYSELCNDIMEYKIGDQFKDMRLVYLPFLAKIQILEKCHTGGIQQKDIENIKRNFKNLVSTENNEEVNILKAILYSRIGDILYYKNRNFESKSPNERNKPCSACRFYRIAISELLMIADDSSLSQLLENIYSQAANIANVKYCNIMAQILSNWGNVFFACDGCNNTCRLHQVFDTLTKIHEDKDVYDIDFWKQWDNFIQHSAYDKEAFKKILCTEHYTKMKLAILMDSLSIKYYKKANDYKRSAFQITKILQMFRYYMPVIEHLGLKNAKKYINTLSNKAIRSLYVAYEGTTLLEINKRKKDFDKTQIDIIPLQTILVDSEIKRITVLVKSLELKLYKRLEPNNIKATLKGYYKLYITSPYGINYSVSARIFRLSLKSTLNWETYKKIVSKKKEDNRYVEILSFYAKIVNKKTIPYIDGIFGGYYTETGSELYIKVFEKLVAETIFCFKEIIRLSKTVGETFLFNHNVMGDIYYYLSDWTILLELYLSMKQNVSMPLNNAKWKEALRICVTVKKSDFIEKLREYCEKSQIEKYLQYYLGKEWRENISGYQDNHNALIHYYKCKETHEEGKAYFEIIDDMYYLKEDFSDRSNHFYMAMERHFINSKEFTERINRLKERYETSQLHKVNNYFFQT